MSSSELPVAVVGAKSPVLFHFFESALINAYEVVSAPSYEEIVDRVKYLKVDLVIIDDKLGEDGIFACLSTLRRLIKSPILVITGSLKRTHHRRLLTAGASDFLAQPLDPVEVEQQIEKAKKGIQVTSKLSSLSKSLPTQKGPTKSIQGFVINSAATNVIEDCKKKNISISIILLELDEIADSEQKWMELDEHLPSGKYQIAPCGKTKRVVLLPDTKIGEAKKIGETLKAVSHYTIGVAHLAAGFEGASQELLTTMIKSAKENKL